jgi:hypothetical protein
MTLIERINAADPKRTEWRHTSEMATIPDALALPDGITVERDKRTEEDEISDRKK